MIEQTIQPANDNRLSATTVERTAPGCNLPVKRGRANHRYRPLGSLRVIVRGGRRYTYIKVRDTGRPDARWRLLSSVVWERARGPIPSGHCLWHANGNGTDCRLENLEMITLAERLRRNIAANIDRCREVWRRQIAKRHRNAAVARSLQAARARRQRATENLA